jgi:hypothetical protein
VSDLIHDCRQGPRCADRRRDDEGLWLPAGTLRPGSLCVACEQKATTAVVGLHVDWRELYLRLPATSSSALDPPVSGSRETPIPIRTSVEACMGDIEEELLRWHRVLTGGEGVPRVSEDAVRVCLASVVSRLPALLRLEPRPVTVTAVDGDGDDSYLTVVLDGVDAVLRLAALHARAQHLVGASWVARWLDHVCPTCRTRTLKVRSTADGQEDTTSCVKCFQVWPDAQLDRWDAMQPALPKEVRA